MNYDKSDIPEESGAGPARGPIMGESDGTWIYPSFAAEGLTTVEFPTRKSKAPFAVAPATEFEALRVKDVGHHIAEQTRRGLRTSQAEASEALHWGIGCLRGSELLDAKSITHLENLAKRFDAAPDPEAFFGETLQPFLRALVPQRR